MALPIDAIDVLKGISDLYLSEGPDSLLVGQMSDLFAAILDGAKGTEDPAHPLTTSTAFALGYVIGHNTGEQRARWDYEDR